MKKESFSQNDHGQTVGKDVHSDVTNKTEHWATYTGTHTPKEHIGTTTHDGPRSTFRRD